MTFLELAEKVLLEEKIPLSSSEIWKIAETNGYVEQLGSQGKTPFATLGAILHVNARDNKNSLFATVGSRPKRFYLKSLNYKKELLDIEALELVNDVEDKSKYSERDLHQLLAYFVYYQMQGYAKTIDHKRTSKKEYADWIHPDMVACYFSIDELEPEVYDLLRSINKSAVRFYSFEIKKKLSFSNLRESFFQTVSNSSWAHESYLVAAEISEEKEFLEELVRLCNSFGIGVILLDTINPDDSEVVIETEEKDKLDVDTIDKLAINPDFKEFLIRVKKDVDSKEIRKEWYDKVETRERLIDFFKNKTY